MKYRLIASLVLVAVLAALAYLLPSQQSTPTPAAAPSTDDATLKSFKID